MPPDNRGGNGPPKRESRPAGNGTADLKSGNSNKRPDTSFAAGAQRCREPSLLEMAAALVRGGSLHLILLTLTAYEQRCAAAAAPALLRGETIDQVSAALLTDVFWRAVATAIFGPLPRHGMQYAITYTRDPGRAGDAAPWTIGDLLPTEAAAYPVSGSA